MIVIAFIREIKIPNQNMEKQQKMQQLACDGHVPQSEKCHTKCWTSSCHAYPANIKSCQV